VALHCIKKLHILDAINTLEQSQKKGGKVMVRTLYNLVDHAKIQGKDSLRLFVDAILIGKTRRYFGVRYHAKGRGCREKRDFCQVKLVFEEKPEK
jgi:ribosomal protein L22